ncbi:MAG: hypothetical protein K6T72_02745 [Anoxybacillus sp.]|nr:hypothetical protein [Anoxybacillus sp.]MCL6585423.1 hypothetical protein [Anoxybacillus sp.]
MNQNLWNVLQNFLEKEVIGTAELALAKETLSPQQFSALTEYLQHGTKKIEGRPWV